MRASTLLRNSSTHDIERVEWRELGPAFIRAWGYQGQGRHDPEHLTVYGKSGGGKSYFVGYVLRMRSEARGSHVAVLATKKTDKTISSFGWPVTDRWPPDYGKDQVVFWAKAKGISAEHRIPQRAKVKEFMNGVWKKDANLIIYWDELTYLEQDLKLKTELATFYREGRSQGITNVASMQRPAGVSRLAHSEAGWTVAFPPKDVDDRNRVAEIFGDRARFRVALDDLDRVKHEFLMRHDRTGKVYISHLPDPHRGRVARRQEVSAPLGYGVPSRRNDHSVKGR